MIEPCGECEHGTIHKNLLEDVWECGTCEWWAPMISDCGCRFKGPTGNTVILCDKCSELPCHTGEQI